jgi:hypothetical protein
MVVLMVALAKERMEITLFLALLVLLPVAVEVLHKRKEAQETMVVLGAAAVTTIHVGHRQPAELVTPEVILQQKAPMAGQLKAEEAVRTQLVQMVQPTV